MKKSTILYLFVLAILLCGTVLESCSEKQEPIVSLTIEKDTILLKSGEKRIVKIKSGGKNYKAQSSNPSFLKVSIISDEIILEAERFKGDANVKVYVTDANYSRAEISVTISSYEQIALNKKKVTIADILLKDTLSILYGEAPYKVELSDSSLLDWKVAGNQIFLTARAKGYGTIFVKDRRNKSAESTILIEGSKKYMNFSDKYFAHATFEDIAAVDQSVKQLRQVTFEMTCNLQGYRGLQTFLGLEGNLIIRGKNDDYRETHPIEIAGLGDKIMLETSNSFPLNKWINIALVVDLARIELSEKYKLFIDGIQETLIVKRSEASHKTIDLTYSNDGGRFEIGRANGQEWRALRGMVSEARVWTVARTADQIKKNRCSLSEETHSGLLAKWDFSTGTQTSVIPDSNKGKYKTDLIISNCKVGGSYHPIIAPLNTFSIFACPF